MFEKDRKESRNFKFKPYISKKIFLLVAVILFVILNFRLIVLGFPFPSSFAPILFFLLGVFIILGSIKESEEGEVFPMNLARKESPRKFFLSFIAGLVMGTTPIVISFIMAFFLNLS